ncbi:MAG: class I SAM-dependent methyltransferase, partial [Nitrospirae bacterium]|nr:class I SAM-dependent methyltransferase [Nitrospirota bacterium]
MQPDPAPENDPQSTLAYNQSFYATHYRNPFLALRYDLIYRSRRLRQILAGARIDLSKPGFRSFEYGFGAAHFLKTLRASETIVGCEFSRSAVAAARSDRPASHPHWHMLDWDDPTSLPFRNGSFDLISCCHVLEHLPDDEPMIREFVRIARPGG